MRVPLDLLLPAVSPRVAGVDDRHVEALALIEGPLPPIVVHRPTLRVIDGTHRLLAARARGETEVRVRFFDGGEADAFVLSVALNNAQGLALSAADRSRAAARIIASHPHWSDRRIARVTGLAASTVGGVRKRSTVRTAQSNARLGMDGRIRPQDIAQRRELAGQFLAEQPQASLRTVAKAAGISLSTAHDVRARLRAGNDLLPPALCKPKPRPKPVPAAPHSAAGAGGTVDTAGTAGADGTPGTADTAVATAPQGAPDTADTTDATRATGVTGGAGTAGAVRVRAAGAAQAVGAADSAGAARTPGAADATSTTRTPAPANAAAAPSTDPPLPRSPRGPARAPVPSDLLGRLRKDPSLRFTEDGRILLHWLGSAVLSDQGAARFVRCVPPHRAAAVAALARSCAQGWLRLAESLDRRGRADV
ncbi:ParB/RepB/Spo0J family partition protein [Streptomyces sp. NPDC087300]|uniref:ParB/RepB/Spo0J family partition protein n=1 Tax=Streptomyces sp. NPDC087300 TaxID=3365780 RepID=UPI0038145350